MKRSGFKVKSLTDYVPSDPKPFKARRAKKCPVCKEQFTPRASTQRVCGPNCAHVYVDQQRIKRERQEDAKKLQSYKPLSYWEKRAEKAFNAYIRKRDEGQGCISCGRKDANVYNAGHYKSVGANPTIRYNEDNVHLQCARPCNKDLGGNIHLYRIALKEKIGVERLEALEGWHAPLKMTASYAQEVEAMYKQKLKDLKK
jgi:hypothetical protein